MIIPTDSQPSKILAFDPARRPEPQPVNLDEPFFEVQHRPHYPACDHRERGVTLDMATRTAICKCGVTVDTFDALLIYAHAQQRLEDTRHYIEAHERKEAEKKAKLPFGQDVCGAESRYAKTKRKDRHGRLLGWGIALRCGHRTYWPASGRFKRHPPRRITCSACYDESVRVAAEEARVAALKTAGVATVRPPGRTTP